MDTLSGYIPASWGVLRTRSRPTTPRTMAITASRLRPLAKPKAAMAADTRGT